jgi:hypothetical protein
MEETNEQAANQFRILFDIDEVDKVPPWGEKGERKLHWYGLTSGRFWIETASGQPLEYTPEIQRTWSLRCKNPDYFVARLFEDLLSVLPLILEPVPADMAARVANPSWRSNAERWRDAEGNDLRWDRWYLATQWWHDRTLDLGYLQHAPDLAFWRVADEVFFQWRADNADNKEDDISVWSAPEGQVCISAAAFEAEVLRFGEELLACMDTRVRSIKQRGWPRQDCLLDVEELAKEQAVRREAFNRISQEQRITDWRQVRSALDVLLALMGESITSGA